MSKRITDHPVLGKIKDQEEIEFTFDEKKYIGFKGDTIASALLANGIRTLRVHEESGSPRGIYCNIGHCFECRVDVNGKMGVRACLQPIEKGMVVESGKVQPAPFTNVEEDHFPRTYTDFVKMTKKGDGSND